MNVIDDFKDPNFCKAAAGVIPIFDKTIGPGAASLTVNIDCTNCFVGYNE